VNRFSLNLATRPFHNNTLYWSAIVACVLLLSAFTWHNVHQHGTVRDDLHTWSSALETHRIVLTKLSSEVASMKEAVDEVDLVAFSKQSNFANSVILSRLFSWTSLFDRLEEVLPPKVRIRSIRPSLGDGVIEISIDGMTPEYGALMEFEEALIQSEHFTLVYPENESSRVKKNEINFNLNFAYLPRGAEEAFPTDWEEEASEGEAGEEEAAPPGAEVDPNMAEEDAADPNEADPNLPAEEMPEGGSNGGEEQP
jgi:Tfp pilus assembly protein PilN